MGENPRHILRLTIPLLGLLFSTQKLLAQATATPTNTPTCTQFTDTYGSSASLNNYDFYNNAWTASTASALSYQVSSGELQVAPSSSTVYSFVIASNSVFNQSLGDYTVEGDFKLGTAAQGVFGLVFRCSEAAGQAYVFQWNGLNNRWEIEKQTGSGGYAYVGAQSTPAYTLGTWIHLKVTASGGTFNAWETPESAPGTASGATVQIFTNVTDATTPPPSPYTTGGAGLRAYNVVAGNILHVQNLTAYNCSLTVTPTFSPTNTATSTATSTPASAITSTPTNTPTLSPTFTVSSTPTATATLTQTTAPTQPPAGCRQFTDNYSSSASLNNYNYYYDWWNASTAAAQFYQVVPGELQVAPSNVTVGYSFAIATNPAFNSSLGDYTVEADFKLDTGGQGVFGPVFRATASAGEAYIFQWNGLDGRWEIEKQTQPGGTGYYYVATLSSPAYTLGTWVHLKVTVSGGTFNAWETPESVPGTASGATLQIFTNVTDTTPAPPSPYTTGNVGLRAYNVVGGNILHMANFTAYSCPVTPTYSGANPPGAGEFFIYPSPARGSQATVSYNMAQSGQVDLRVWNEKAELVTQVTDSKTTGVQITSFSIAGFGSGVYFYALTLSYDSGQVEKLGPKKFAILH